MADDDNDDCKMRHISGKLREHFAFLTSDAATPDGIKISCLHCKKQFAYRGSNTSLTYHLQHKHPLQYHRVVANERKKNDDAKHGSMLNFVSTQSNKPVSDRVCEDLKGAIAQWIASSGRPTAVVEDPGLQTVLRVALQNQQYNVPSRRTVDNIISHMYYDKLQEHRKTVDNITSLALTTDFWTSNNNESYCGITGHWIDCEWKLTSITLDCLHVQERHTAANVASLYTQFADEWHIADKIRCIVTDNARNMVAAIGLTEYSHLPCVAHCIQLSILEGLKAADASPLLAKCRHLVGHFKHSAANTAELKASHSHVQVLVVRIMFLVLLFFHYLHF